MTEHFGIPVRRLDTIEPPENKCFSFGLVGSTRSGKSCAMLWLWENYFKEHITIMMTGSAQASIYKPLMKHTAVSPDFYPELIKEPMTLNQKTGNKYKFLHIFDDMLDGKNTKALAKLLCIGRNNGMFYYNLRSRINYSQQCWTHEFKLHAAFPAKLTDCCGESGSQLLAPCFAQGTN